MCQDLDRPFSIRRSFEVFTEFKHQLGKFGNGEFASNVLLLAVFDGALHERQGFTSFALFTPRGILSRKMGQQAINKTGLALSAQSLHLITSDGQHD